MPVDLSFSRQERPAGLSTLDAVRALRDEAEAAAMANNFPDLPSAAAADLPASIRQLNAGGIAYVRDSEGTALVQADGSRWSPATGKTTPRAWGATPGTDAQAQINLALQSAPADGILDLEGFTYPISQRLVANKRVQIENGNLEPTDDFPVDDFLVDVTYTGYRGVELRNINLDGRKIANLVRAGTGAKHLKMTNVHGKHMRTLGVHGLGKVLIRDCRFVEWEWTDPERQDWANYSATGILIEKGDSEVDLTTVSHCGLPLHIKASTTKVLGGHYYNSGMENQPAVQVNILLDDVVNTHLVGVYIDNATLHIRKRFANVVSGCFFQKMGTAPTRTAIFCETDAVDETVAGLTVTGCIFQTGFADGVISFGGTGTYVPDDDKDIQWVGNTRTDGSLAWRELKARNTFMAGRFETWVKVNGSKRLSVKNTALEMLGGLATAGGAKVTLASMGGDSFALQPSNGVGGAADARAFGWDADLNSWVVNNGVLDLLPRHNIVDGNGVAQVRSGKALQLHADKDGTFPGLRAVQVMLAGVVQHEFRPDGLIIGVSAGPASQGVAKLRYSGSEFMISPAMAGGGFDDNAAIVRRNGKWIIRGGAVNMPNLPNSSPGSAAVGDLWVDEAAGNVLKVKR